MDENQTISLRSLDMMSGVTVDRAAGKIKNVSVMSPGEAKGHGFEIDKTMTGQVANQMSAGVPMRFKHPVRPGPDGRPMPTESLGTHVGRVTNPRLDDSGKVKGDIEFGPHADKVPGLGNVSGYLMDLAESDPKSFGLSVVFKPGTPTNRNDKLPLMRSRGVVAADLTADPAANSNGLLSSTAADAMLFEAGRAAGAIAAAREDQIFARLIARRSRPSIRINHVG